MSIEIKFDRASKFYEPGVLIIKIIIYEQEKVTGTFTFNDATTYI